MGAELGTNEIENLLFAQTGIPQHGRIETTN
jgi:hypothetical protein